MSRLSIGISKRVGHGKVSFDWSSYWTPQNELDGELPSFHITKDSRSGMSLIDSVNTANNPQILSPVFMKTNNLYYDGDKTRVQEHIFDGNDYTIFFELTQFVEAGDTVYYKTIAGIGMYANGVGRGIWVYVHAGTLRVLICDGVVAQINLNQILTVNTNVLPLGRLYWHATINGTTKKFNSGLYNSAGTLVGSYLDRDISTFTFNTNDNTQAYTFASEHFGISNFKKFSAIKTLEQCMADSYVTDLQLHYPYINGSVDLASGLTLDEYHGTELTSVRYSNHNPWLLNYGFDVYRANPGPLSGGAYVDHIIPHDVNGNSVAWVNANYTFVKSVAGTLINTPCNINCNYKIRFIQDFFDRSNTTIWNDNARLGYYDAAHTKDFHISELDQRKLYEMLEVGYKGRLYIHCDDSSIVLDNSVVSENRVTLKEIFLYDTDKLLSDNRKALTYTGDIAAAVLSINNLPSYDTNNYIKIGYFKSSKPMVTIRYDDGVAANYGWRTVHLAYNKNAVVALISSFIDTVGMTSQQVRDLYGDGWEIQSHGYEGNPPQWSEMSNEDVTTAIVTSKIDIEAMGVTCDHLTWHGTNGSSSFAQSFAKTLFRSYSGWPTIDVGNGINPTVVDFFNYKLIAIDLPAYGFEMYAAEGMAAIKAAIDVCKAENRWAIFVAHGYTVEKGANLAEIIEYCNTNNVDIVTVDEAMANCKYL